MAKYHHYEIASAAFQIGIVLASAAVITSIAALAWIAGGLGVIGLGLLALGLFAPYAVFFFFFFFFFFLKGGGGGGGGEKKKESDTGRMLIELWANKHVPPSNVN